MECSICGISGKMRSVFEVISPKGVILACEKCAFEEGFPILKKPDKNVFEESERKGTVYERMARLSGVRHTEPDRPELKKQEESLRKIIDRNYEEKIRMQDLSLKSRSDLIDKFHWIIMRVRRVKGLTQKQLAEVIGESEAAIKMAEQGVVPGGYEFMDKLERFLKVKLIKERTSSMLGQSKDNSSRLGQIKERNLYRDSWPNRGQTQKTLNFDKQSLDSLTIADLQRMKKERRENRPSMVNLKETRPSDAELKKKEKEVENDK